MQLLTDSDLREAIRRAVSAGDVSCAVAFWGRGAENLIGSCKGRKVRLICNLRMGGTNPDVIAALIEAGAEVLQSDRLHAKVYIGAVSSVVTSANASTNGLGIEGQELSGWIETGVEVSPQTTQPWFDDLWPRCMPITDDALETARKLFRERKMLRPSSGRFDNFYPTEDDFPLVGWESAASSLDYDEAAIEKEFGRIDNSIRSWIDNAAYEYRDDSRFLQRGIWILRWTMRNDGHPSRRYAPRWTCSSGNYIENAIRSDGEFLDAILPMDPAPPEPFDATEPGFKHAFVEVLSRPTFDDLRETNYDGSFYASRKEKTWAFWQALRKYYDGLAAST